MMLRLALSVAALLSGAAAALAAPVATLDDVAGMVLIDQGRGFAAASAPVELSSGSRIMLSRTGVATLVYPGANGCRLRLSPNTITAVGSSRDCKPGAEVAGQAAVVVVPPVVVPPLGIPPVAIAIGVGAAAAAGVSLAVISAEQQQDPASN